MHGVFHLRIFLKILKTLHHAQESSKRAAGEQFPQKSHRSLAETRRKLQQTPVLGAMGCQGSPRRAPVRPTRTLWAHAKWRRKRGETQLFHRCTAAVLLSGRRSGADCSHTRNSKSRGKQRQNTGLGAIGTPGIVPREPPRPTYPAAAHAKRCIKRCETRCSGCSLLMTFLRNRFSGARRWVDRKAQR